MSASDVVDVIRGIPVPNVPWFPKKNITDVFNYIPHEGDIIIGSYPKTGTSWLQYIVQQIISKGDSLPNFADLICKVIPYVEMAGIDAIEALPEPRIYKHHFAYNAVQRDHKAKYLYMYRNPEDVFISYYHFFQDVVEEPMTIDEFMDDFLEGNVWYGNYCEHVLSYLSQENSDKVLMISYENLIANRKDEVLRIAKFLGEGYYQDLVNDEAMLDKIVQHTEFEYMKENVDMMLPEIQKENQPSPKSKNRMVNKIFRKGTVGDGTKSLSEAQLKRLREHVAIKMKGTRMAEEWLPKGQS